MSAQKHRRRLDVAVVALFLGAIYAPTLDLFVRDDGRRDSTREFRNPTEKPGVPRTAKDYYKFPKTYEAHFNDTFGLRDRLLSWNSYEKYFWLGTGPAKTYAVGRDGWVFFAGDESMEIIRGARAFTERQLTDWQLELEGRAQMHAAAGRRYVFVIVPNKETIYPERLPASIHATGPTRLDQLLAWMRARSNVDILDMRSAFMAAKKDDTGPMDPLYTPHGTHWTSRGVYVAYAALVGHLAEGTSWAGPVPLSEFEIITFPDGADSFAHNLYLTGVLVQPGTAMIRKTPGTYSVLEHKDSTPKWLRTAGRGPNLLPHTIIFHDSFGPFIAHTIPSAFEKLDMSETNHDRTRIDAKKTKIVIEMYVERYLRNHKPWPHPEAPLPDDGGTMADTTHVLFDLRATPERARPIEGLELTRTLDGGFKLVRKHALDGLVLGPFQSPARGEVRVLIDLEASEPASLDLMWRRTRDQSFTRMSRTQLPIGPGRDTRDIALPALGGECELMLRPTEMQPAIIIHGCTIGSAEAP